MEWQSSPRRASILGTQDNPSGGEGQETGERAQQRRFARSVRSSDDERLAGAEAKAEAGENATAAAFDAEARGFDLHGEGSTVVLWRAACMARLLVV